MAKRNYHWALIKVLNWEKYNPRSDSRNNTWFRMQNTLWLDSRFNAMPVSARAFYMYLLSTASDHSKDVLSINVTLSFTSLNLLGARSKDVLSTLHNHSWIAILSESHAPPGASPRLRTNGFTEIQTDVLEPLVNAENQEGETTDHSGDLDAPPQPAQPLMAELSSTVAFALRMEADFAKIKDWLAENGVLTPELDRALPEIYQGFGRRYQTFEDWVVTQIKELKTRSKDPAERARWLNYRLLVQAGKIKPKGGNRT